MSGQKGSSGRVAYGTACRGRRGAWLGGNSLAAQVAGFNTRRIAGDCAVLSLLDVVVAEIVVRYEQKKWGKDIHIEEGRFCRGEEREQKRGMKR